MLNLALPTKELVLDVLAEQYQLEKIANLSIFESPKLKDNYLSLSLDFVLNQSINTVSGELFFKETNHVVYSLTKNTLFASWLLSAGRALFSGELVQYGLTIIRSADNKIKQEKITDSQTDNNADSLIINESCASYWLSEKDLIKQLTYDEIKLLEGYTGVKFSQKANQKYPCIFKNYLKQAAKNSKLMAKQAQILDGSLRAKLAGLISNKKLTLPLSNINLAVVVSCMSQALLWYQRELQLEAYFSLLQKLTNIFNAKTEQATNEKIYCAYVLLESTQVVANEPLTISIINWLESHYWEKVFLNLTKTNQIYLARIFSYLSSCKKIELPSYISRFILQENLAKLLVYKGNNYFFEKYRASEFLYPKEN